MTETVGDPTAWADYSQSTAGQPMSQTAPLARFASRYRMARQFAGLRHTDTVSGPARDESLEDLEYDALLGLAFAATALDSLEVALRRTASDTESDPLTLALHSPELRSRWVGRNLKPVRFAVTSFLTDDARRRLDQLEYSDDADVRPIVDAFGDLALRGDVTPAALQFDRIILDDSFLEDLRRFTLDAADAAFTAWVATAAASR